jgi:hypothetical protein
LGAAGNRELKKAFELRTKEATDLATRYAAGEISPEEATKRFLAFDRRWGEAMYGASAGENVSDDQILANIDEARRTGRLRLPERGDTSGKQRGR